MISTFNFTKKLIFDSDTSNGAKESDIIFICAGMPPLPSGNPGEAKKLGDKNKQRVEKVFSWGSSIKDTVEAFKKLTHKNK